MTFLITEQSYCTICDLNPCVCPTLVLANGEPAKRECRYLDGTHPDEWFVVEDETMDKLENDSQYEVRWKLT